MSISPRPTWLLIFNALAVMAVCGVMFAYFLFVIFTMNNPGIALGSSLVLFIPLLIAAMQYRAVFRRNENAARNVGNYLFIAGGLLAIFFAMMTYIYVANGKGIDYRQLAMLGLLTLACVYLLFCGLTNQRWAKQLQREMENAPDKES
jgi:Ca2+/Na+ antiporter